MSKGFEFPNHLYLDAPEREATEVMTALAAGKVTEEEFAVWVQKNVYATP